VEGRYRPHENGVIRLPLGFFGKNLNSVPPPPPPNGTTALVGQGLLIVKDSSSHSVGHTTLIRTSVVE